MESVTVEGGKTLKHQIDHHLGRTLSASTHSPYSESEEQTQLDRAAIILKNIAHPIRLGIIQQLNQHERLSVGQICAALNAEQSLISHHLSNMKLVGILSSTRVGKNVFYSLKERNVLKVLHCIETTLQ
jgi:ArsR family transcriptional regulator